MFITLDVYDFPEFFRGTLVDLVFSISYFEIKHNNLYCS